MNIFEEFVEELKQENLLEDTVCKSKGDGKKQSESSEHEGKDDVTKENDSLETESTDSADEGGDEDSVTPEDCEGEDLADEEVSDSSDERGFELTLDKKEGEEQGFEVANAQGFEIKELSESEGDEETEVEDKDAHRQRLTDNVSSLQMVDHILAGVQREQMRARPEVFDSLPAKKALHKFFEAFNKVEDSEATPEEFALVKEIELWHSTLLDIDAKMRVADLRRYCESTKPALSSQAMISMLRFYRNSPYSEDVRCKFDLVATRLFTKDIGDGKRGLIFERAELIEYIKELYANWASTPLYSEDEQDEDIISFGGKFDEYVEEALDVTSFDDLIKQGFFKRLKLFKKKNDENFFAPIVLTAAIECNVGIGNHYVDLIEEERARVKLENRGNANAGDLNAESKSSQLARLLSEGETSDEKESRKFSLDFLDTNAFKLGLGIIAFALVSFFVWVLFLSGSQTIPTVPKGPGTESTLNMEGASFEKYLSEATVKGTTLYGMTSSAWSDLSESEKENVLRDVLKFGKEKGYIKVRLLLSPSMPAGFASRGGINVVE